MKFQGINVTLTDNKIDDDTVYLSWLEKDTREQDDRYAAFKKDLVAVIAERGEWLPAIHRGVLQFFTNAQFRREKIAKPIIAGMVTNTLVGAGVVPITAVKKCEAAVVDYLGELTSDSQDTNVMLWQDATRGKGAAVYVSPLYRDGEWITELLREIDAPRAAPADEPAAPPAE